MQKSIFGTHAEVAYSQEAHFLQYKFTRELQLQSSVAEKILQCQWRDLHDITDVEAVNPFTLIQVAQDVFHIRLPAVVEVLAWLS